jgi:PII-like signaling protein
MGTHENSILKIYASSTDKVGSKIFYEHIVYLAKEKGISGVTVYRGIMGYGSSSKHISTSKFWELTEKLPVTIEIIDKTIVLESFYKIIEHDLLKMSKGCLVTLNPISVKLHKPGH